MNRPFLEMTIDEVKASLRAAGAQPFRADQLADWVYRKGVTDAAAMSNLPAALTRGLSVLTSRIAGRADSTDGTIKLLIELHDGEHIECVMIPTAGRATACVSTQVGCAMRCGFCASGADGFRRNLTSGEILEQLLHLRQAGGRAITNVVFMGIGEPLANYDATVSAVRAIIDPQRFGISARRVTVSTVGLPKQIRRLAAEDIPVTLAISLHAFNDALRRQIIPAAAGAPMEDILAAAEEFYRSRKRELTLEYVLLGGLNDTNLCADGLARVAGRLRCNVNLISYNPAETAAQSPYSRPSQASARAFLQRLRRKGVNVHLRQSRGLDAAAACGQLRLESTAGQAGDQS